MQEICIVMNCLGEAIEAYFNKIPQIYNNFNITRISTYSNLNDISVLDKIKNVDFLIVNNVKNYELFKPVNLKLHVKESCKVITIEYLRFCGFYPLDSHKSKKNMLLIYDDSFKNSNTYEEYVDYKINNSIITERFNESLKKLKILDENSDIKFYDFFIENYKHLPLFRDENHPSDIFFKYIIIKLLEKMEIYICNEYINKLTIQYTYGFKFRYRPILKCVKDVLKLNFEDNTNMYNKNINNVNFYNIIKQSLKLTDQEIEKEFLDKKELL